MKLKRFMYPLIVVIAFVLAHSASVNAGTPMGDLCSYTLPTNRIVVTNSRDNPNPTNDPALWYEYNELNTDSNWFDEFDAIEAAPANAVNANRWVLTFFIDPGAIVFDVYSYQENTNNKWRLACSSPVGDFYGYVRTNDPFFDCWLAGACQ